MEARTGEFFGILRLRHFTYYGRETFKVTCPKGEGILRLLKQKTLTRENVEALRALGFRIEVEEVL